LELEFEVELQNKCLIIILEDTLILEIVISAIALDPDLVILTGIGVQNLDPGLDREIVIAIVTAGDPDLALDLDPVTAIEIINREINKNLKSRRNKFKKK
jgi:hypothetical protein